MSRCILRLLLIREILNKPVNGILRRRDEVNGMHLLELLSLQL